MPPPAETTSSLSASIHDQPTMNKAYCSTCGIALTSSPILDEKTEKPSTRPSRQVDCCGRQICGACIERNARFAEYCALLLTYGSASNGARLTGSKVPSARSPRGPQPSRKASETRLRIPRSPHPPHPPRRRRRRTSLQRIPRSPHGRPRRHPRYLNRLKIRSTSSIPPTTRSPRSHCATAYPSTRSGARTAFTRTTCCPRGGRSLYRRRSTRAV